VLERLAHLEAERLVAAPVSVGNMRKRKKMKKQTSTQALAEAEPRLLE
jgi:hypothetical protein